MLDQIQEQILRKNVRRYLELVLQQARQSHGTPVEQALKRTLTDVETRIRRWEDTLERQLLSLEDAAHRIKERGEKILLEIVGRS